MYIYNPPTLPVSQSLSYLLLSANRTHTTDDHIYNTYIMTSTHTPWTLSIHTPIPPSDPYSSPVLFIISYLCLFFSFSPILVCKYTCHRTCEPKVCTTLTFFFFFFLLLFLKQKIGKKKFKTRQTKKEIEVLFIFGFS